MKTGKEFIQSLEGLNRKIFILGEQVENPTKHPILKPSLNALAKTYDITQDQEKGKLFVRTGIQGNPINCFTSIHQNTQDLVDKVKAQRILGQETGTCYQRCVGWDAINALESTTYEMDQALNTTYHQNFLEYLRFLQEEDLVCNGAMTDVKGNRNLRPSQQTDPDMYLHVVDRSPDCIIVRVAKAHQTGAIFSHEIIVMPTLSLRSEDEDYAISFAIPSDSPGIIYILGRQSCDTRKLEGVPIDVGNPNFGGHESLVIFDDVFVPNERIFMDGEWQFSKMLVERFAAYHRQSYGGCKVGMGDVLIGAAATACEYAGVENAHHIKQKLAEMVQMNETLFSCGLSCSLEGCAAPSGTYLVDSLLANVCKLNVTRFPYEISRLAEDLAGGLMVTMPSEKDLKHKGIGHLVEKYLRGAEQFPTEDRMRILRLIENLTMGTGAVSYRTESMHGAGSPQAQMIMINRIADLEGKKKLAQRLVGISR
jgi:4-hydroxybutyryl-CoA dehydratase/vinylacetyl-CoA-Delta-isomerase